MNRYSFLFAAIVAATFVTPAPRAGDTPESARVSGKPAHEHRTAQNEKPKLHGVDPDSDIEEFLAKRVYPANEKEDYPDVLFATVPHPTETHLAADFDSNVAALEEGIQDSGYFFDAAWIPWEVAHPYERLDDDQTEKDILQYEDGFPGYLLFRNAKVPQSAPGSPDTQQSPFDAYGKGLIVFLIAEKPTAGLEVQQVDQALKLMTKHKIPLKSPIRIAGPNFSGSLNSLSPALTLLHQANITADFLIRADVASAEESNTEIEKIAAQMQNIHIDFGSTSRGYKQWTDLAVAGLDNMGMKREEIAFLNEDESLYGLLSEKDCLDRDIKKPEGCGDSWQIPFPRDISSLRAGYENQGVFDGTSPVKPWKHFLNLKNDEESEGDTVRSFGGVATTADQEAVLFGISEFLRAHSIHAVVISATNPEDAYFLSQFFHANNGGVRIVIVAGTRLFLRGSTAQFRGDMVVDDFPMLPRLHDWTGGAPGPNTPGRKSYAEHIFSNGFGQGAYIAVLDLIASHPSGKYPWISEYSMPNLGENSVNRAALPPMYLTSLGGDAPWPVMLRDDPPLQAGNTDPAFAQHQDPKATESKKWRVQLPFALFQHDASHPSDPQPANTFLIGHFWKILFWIVWSFVLCYCVCFWYANPLTRRVCASFEPIATWRYWLFTVTLPATIAGSAFQVLAAPVDIPSAISPDIAFWWWIAILSCVVAPLLISLSAWRKANASQNSQGHAGRWVALLLPAPLMALFAHVRLWNFCGPASDTSSTLNAFREMHWESGLSLVPTWLLVLAALFLWTRGAGQSIALFNVSPVLPTFRKDLRISNPAVECANKIALPWPGYRIAKWLWWSWGAGVAFLLIVVTWLPAFRAVTTLESHLATRCIVYASTAIASLMLLDVFQFLWLWSELRKLLRALNSHPFKRSFVPINDFKWAGFWSFSGVSFYDQRVILSSIVDCIIELKTAPFNPHIAKLASNLKALRTSYWTGAQQPGIPQFRTHLALIFQITARVSSEIAAEIETPAYPGPKVFSPGMEARLRALVSHGEKKSPFTRESEEVARLLDWQRQSERLLCLSYISFIQVVVARLHGLMLSVAGMFSLMAVAVAVYPFAPMSPFFLCAITILPLIAWAFFHVFSQMDTDPILSRITNGDDGKLEWSFYGKFAESLALPVLTLASSLLPGGVGRVLDVARMLLNHSQ